MKADISKNSLPLYEALASEVRLNIIGLLAGQPMNVKDIAAALNLSSAIVTMHIRKLELGGLIRTEMVRKDKGTHKICSLAVDRIEIAMPVMEQARPSFHEATIPIGHYTEFEVHPTCGLATRDKLIGQYDDPRYFLEPDRVRAGILWFGKGFVEYKIPNYLLSGQQPSQIEISMELGSEAPGFNENWPSDIDFYLNGVHLGQWTSPGDYGSSRGRYTPSWWQNGVNQYGLLKVIRITADGTFIDGQRMSDTGIGDIGTERNQWTLRLAVLSSSEHVGGLTLYGEGFGNYNQDIVFRVYYE
ncbi:ArsR/SmtB family transcription factor [Paenibacillus hamazuiensis]|uniref:ArsR/SmtB family transcription factor n=1 Tax=Paenibacillus hamazuiensis TaxID=2936508 RepID=UPI00200D2FFA|nr:helix-turn-helix domain-containing protein [Paenibacillus hamazuiensis]